MALQGTKKASSTLAGQPPAKKPTPVRSSPSLAKKSTPAQSSLLQVVPSYWHGASIRDLFEGGIDSGRDNNNNDDKAANNNFSLEKFSEDNDNIQFTLFGLQVILANIWFLGGSLYAHKTKALDARAIFSPHNYVHVRQSE